MIGNLEINNDEYFSLYQWKNGLTEESFQNKLLQELELFPFGIMLSLEEAISTYHTYTNKNKLWDCSLFPIFTSGGGDYLLFDFGKGSKNFEKILLYSPSILLSTEPMTIYDSLINLFATVYTCYRKDAYQIYPNYNFINVNFEVEHALSKSMNPQSKYWFQ